MSDDVACGPGGEFRFEVTLPELPDGHYVYGEWAWKRGDTIYDDLEHPRVTSTACIPKGENRYEVVGTAGFRGGTYINQVSEVRDAAGRTVRELPRFRSLFVFWIENQAY